MIRAQLLVKGLGTAAVLAMMGTASAQVTVDTTLQSGDAKLTNETLEVLVSISDNTLNTSGSLTLVPQGATFEVEYDTTYVSWVGVSGVDLDGSAGEETAASAGAENTVSGTVVKRRVSVIMAANPTSPWDVFTPDLAVMTFQTAATLPGTTFDILIGPDTSGDPLPYLVYDGATPVNTGSYDVTDNDPADAGEFQETGTLALSVSEWMMLD